MLRQSDIYNFILALVCVGITMLWTKKPESKPDNRDGATKDDAQYRWNDGEWRTPSYEHWSAGNSDYQTDERNYWCHQVRALWTGIAIRIATFIAALWAGIIAYWAYGANSEAVVEARKQTVEAQKQTIEAKRQADAGEVQIAVAKDTEIRQLRAYVVVDAQVPIQSSAGIPIGVTYLRIAKFYYV